MKNRLLIYGCNGYTGALISRLAAEKNLQPILAGRNEAAVRSLATELGCEWHSFELSEREKLHNCLAQVHTVLHCAGPFVFTSDMMLAACAATGTHYLDITGEISVFENIARQNNALLKAGTLAMPGVGFDVVPTDCLALYLKELLPDATHIELALMATGGRLSHGTAITIVESLGAGSACRVAGKITASKSGAVTREIDFGVAKKWAVEIPWGDVSTAFYTTGIPNIRVYNVLPKSLISKMRWSNYMQWLLRMRWVKDRAIKNIKARPAGPSADERQSVKTYVWGEVKNAQGEVKRALLTLPEGYLLTAQVAVEIASRVLRGAITPRGFKTPASVFGSNFILEFERAKRVLLA